jgi:hypothetical protein
MSTHAYHEVLNQVINQVEHLAPEDQTRLLEDLEAIIRRKIKTRPEHTFSELEGLGAEVWKGIDAQEYVNQERDAWEK